MQLIHWILLSLCAYLTHCADITEISACLGGSWKSCLGLGTGLISQGIKLHSWDDGTTHSMFGTTCRSSVKGRVSSFKWVWDARFSCDSYPFEGRGVETGRGSAVNTAITDWVNQAASVGIFDVIPQIGRK